MRNKYINKNISMYLVVMLLVMGVFVLIGSSYALVQKVIYGRNVVSMQTGSFLVEFINSDAITLTNKIPVYDDVGMNSGDEFTFSITNNGNHNASYNIYIEDNSDNNLSDVMRYAVNYGDGYSYQNIHALKNNHYIIQNKSLSVGNTDTYSLRFWLDIDAGESYASLEFSGKIKVEATQEEYKYATNIIEKIYNSTDQEGIVAIGEDGKLYSSGDIKEYRYKAGRAKNYVWFNCKEGYTSGEAHCEKWRIIGSVTNTYENGVSEYPVLKIVREETLETQKAYNDSTGNYANFKGSSIQTYLNTEYYNTFSKTTKELVMNAKWNIGEVSSSSYISVLDSSERGLSDYNYVGLLNVSDYGYAGTDYLGYEIEANSFHYTINSNWLTNLSDFMLLNTKSLTSTNIYYINHYIDVGPDGESEDDFITIADGDTITNYGVRPCVYLKPDVSIIGGFGTSDSPYELSVKNPMYYGTKTEIKVDSISLKTLGKLNLNVNTSSDGCPVEGEKITSIAGSGVDLVCEYSDDDGKTYYFRGASTHNYVKWAGFYWRIIRVNGDGSIRLIYAGDADVIDSLSNKAEVLANGYDDSTTKYTQIGTNAFHSSSLSSVKLGLMYGDLPDVYTTVLSDESYTTADLTGGSTFYYGDTYNIDETTGELSISPRTAIKPTVDNIETLIGKYIFPYASTTTSAYATLMLVESVDIELGTITGKKVVRSFIDGLDKEDSYNKTHENKYFSTIMGTEDSANKSTLNGWYNINIKNKSFENDVSDTIICNDRSIYKSEYGTKYSNSSQILGIIHYSGTSPDSGVGFGTEPSAFGAYYRIRKMDKPSLKCLQKNDRFTVSNNVGNMDLVNPIGLISVDEIALAGGQYDAYNNKYYLNTGNYYFSSSPSYIYGLGNSYAMIMVINSTGMIGSGYANNAYGVRPVLSIDPSKVEISGTGTWNDPFIFS